MTRERLEVLFAVPSLEAGGAERVVVNLANGLVGLDVTVGVVATGTLGVLAEQLVPAVTAVGLGSTRVRSAMPALLRHVRRRPPHVIVATHTHLNLALCAMRSLLPQSAHLVVREPTHTPVEMDGRSTRNRRIAQRLLYGSADLAIASSPAMEADLRRLTGAPTLLLANPVDEEAIRVSAAAPATSVTARATSGRRFVSVGRIDSQKSLPELLTAFAAGTDPGDELVLIGDGPVESAVRAAADRLGIADRVHMLGFLPRPWSEVAASDAFLLASRAEGMPNAVLESLAVGVPVLSTDELPGVTSLAQEAPPGAVTLVPRPDLAGAIRALPRLPANPTDGARPSLLPARFRTREATATLWAALETLRTDGGR